MLKDIVKIGGLVFELRNILDSNGASTEVMMVDFPP